MLRHGNCLSISIAADLVLGLAERCKALSVEELFSESGIHSVHGAKVERIVGPAFQGHLPPHNFHPVVVEGVRPLVPSDIPHLRSLQAASDPREWEHSSLSEDLNSAFGCFIEGQLAAVCRIIMRSDLAADFGVLTHPHHRGRNLAKAVVSASVEEALRRGFLLVYQTLLSNKPAVGIAKALGFEEYGQSLAARFKEMEPQSR